MRPRRDARRGAALSRLNGFFTQTIYVVRAYGVTRRSWPLIIKMIRY
jgi:hypothetical protein